MPHPYTKSSDAPPVPKTKYRYLVSRETGDILLRSSRTLGVRDEATELLVDSNEKLVAGEHSYDFDIKDFGKIPKADIMRRRQEQEAPTTDKVDAEFAAAFKALPAAVRKVVILMLQDPESLLPIALELDAKLTTRETRAKKKAGTKKAPTKSKTTKKS